MFRDPQHVKPRLVIESAVRLNPRHVARTAGRTMYETQVFVVCPRRDRREFYGREYMPALQAAG